MRKRLDKLLKGIEDFSRTHGRMANIERETGELLRLLVSIRGAKSVLEIGTANGYSTIWLAEAVRKNKGGKVVTIEKDPLKVNLARANFSRAGLTASIDLRYGDAEEIIKTKLKGKFDLVFLDAAKGEYLSYFQWVFPKTKRGTIFVADNAISRKDEMKEYLNYVRKHPKLQSVLIPVGKGEEVTLRL